MWLPARTAAPQPPKTSKKVPISSASYRFIHPPGFFTNGDSRKRYNLNTTSEPHGQVRVSTLEQLPARRFPGLSANQACSALVQKAHRLAPMGISLKHSVHRLVVGSGGGSRCIRAVRALTG